MTGWTQPICRPCWKLRFPGRKPTQLVPSIRTSEKCVDCGRRTVEGIYARVDPAEQRFPTLDT